MVQINLSDSTLTHPLSALTHPLVYLYGRQKVTINLSALSETTPCTRLQIAVGSVLVHNVTRSVQTDYVNESIIPEVTTGKINSILRTYDVTINPLADITDLNVRIHLTFANHTTDIYTIPFTVIAKNVLDFYDNTFLHTIHHTGTDTRVTLGAKNGQTYIVTLSDD